uniref:Putative secreted protein n=1 Tax=Anopheles darlingi TaxID=43151 RepID=A0A2M4D3L5_ANODA
MTPSLLPAIMILLCLRQHTADTNSLPSVLLRSMSEELRLAPRPPPLPEPPAPAVPLPLPPPPLPLPVPPLPPEPELENLRLNSCFERPL